MLAKHHKPAGGRLPASPSASPVAVSICMEFVNLILPRNFPGHRFSSSQKTVDLFKSLPATFDWGGHLLTYLVGGVYQLRAVLAKKVLPGSSSPELRRPSLLKFNLLLFIVLVFCTVTIAV